MNTADRARLLEMESRFARPRLITWAMISITLMGTIPWIGPWPAVLFAGTGAVLIGVSLLARRSERPEVVLAASMLVNQVTMGVAIAVTGGPASPVTPILINSMASLAVRFRGPVVSVGVVVTLGILLASTVAVDPRGFLESPVIVMCTACVISAVAVFCSMVMRAELDQRTASSLDPLTGLLNRKALRARFDEVREQAMALDGTVSVVVLDIDHFKRVNDVHGHYTGDEVLVAVSETLRSALRSFELLYRVGGEEFVAVFPGTDSDTARTLAERLRAAVQAARPAGIDVTISVGVSTAAGTDVDYARMFQEADAALYEAKRAGRNAVVVAGEAPPPRRSHLNDDRQHHRAPAQALVDERC